MRATSRHPAFEQPWAMGLSSAQAFAQCRRAATDGRCVAMLSSLIEALSQFAGSWLDYQHPDE